MTPLGALFGRHPHLRAVLDAVLEGRQGRSRALGDPPAVAVLELGCYLAPGGDADHEGVASLLAGAAGPVELVVPDDDRWRHRLGELFPGRLADRSMKAFVFDGPTGPLDALAGMLPDGYELSPMDGDDAAALDPGLSPHGVGVFGGAEGFMRGGFGLCARFAGVPVCAATSYAVSADKVEVAIATREDHRGRGLATAVAAAMLADSVRRGLTPHWNAHNPVSIRLAHRLGLRPVGTCEILMLDGD